MEQNAYSPTSIDRLVFEEHQRFFQSCPDQLGKLNESEQKALAWYFSQAVLLPGQIGSAHNEKVAFEKLTDEALGECTAYTWGWPGLIRSGLAKLRKAHSQVARK